MRGIPFVLTLLMLGSASDAAQVQVGGKPQEVNICGGLVGIPCPKPTEQWCDFPKESVCGVADFLGVCRQKPEICTDHYLPVCGCDGFTYSNECVAHQYLTDVAYTGKCLDKDPGARKAK